MNERIRQLAEQATCDIKDEFGNWINSEFNKEKFAELIVRECIDVVGKATASPNGYQAIMNHFGVEK
jgi:hypothetical protein